MKINFIICEGICDKAVLEYCLKFFYKYEYVNESDLYEYMKVNLNKKYNHNDIEDRYIYSAFIKDENIVIIMATTGKTNLFGAVGYVYKLISEDLNDNDFKSIIMLTDYDDDKSIKSIQTFCEKLKIKYTRNIKVNQVIETNIKNNNCDDINQNIKVLYELVPKDENGAIETFFANILKKNRFNDNEIITAIDNLRKVTKESNKVNLLKKNKFYIKSEFTIMLALMYPERNYFGKDILKEMDDDERENLKIFFDNIMVTCGAKIFNKY